MRTLQIRAALAGLVLLLGTGLCSLVLFHHSSLADQLLPRESTAFPWDVVLSTDEPFGGNSQIQRQEGPSSFAFQFLVGDTIQYPFVSFSVNFTSFYHPVTLADWSRYQRLQLRIRCSPYNILSFALYTHDDDVTQAEDFESYRVSEAHISCREEPQDLSVDLTQLVTPEWWFRRNGVDYAKRAYRLDKVLGFALHNSQQSPKNVLSSVVVTSASIHGRDWRYIYAAVGLHIVTWGLFIVWYIRRRSTLLMVEITEKIQQERPVIAYQQLPDDTRQDRERNAVLRYMTTHYMNPELNLDTVAVDLGINRTKLNAILKDETNLTFSGYINKLRLTEAARLLLKSESSITDIALEVGYSSSSYFTTVFKKEYQCTPGEFRRLMRDQSALE